MAHFLTFLGSLPSRKVTPENKEMTRNIFQRWPADIRAVMNPVSSGDNAIAVTQYTAKLIE